MCVDCGCSDGAKATMTNMASGRVKELAIAGHAHDHDHDHHHHHDGHHHDHSHHHGHDHDHSHDHDHPHGHGHDHHHHHDHGEHPHGSGGGGAVSLEQAILAKNDSIAALNRAWLAGRGVLMLNLVSSPGSGKTSLLERTIKDLSQELSIHVVEGDQATTNDAARIEAAGARAVQVNTGKGCHLEADMIEQAFGELRPGPGSVMFVENVGNLVCPSLFDLGERAKVAILSVTEGEDKPLKYPHMFQASSLMLLNKCDLLPHLDFDIEKAIAAAREVNPGIEIIQLSAKSGEGMDLWYAWVRNQLAAVAA